MRSALLLILVGLASVGLAEEASLGDVARKAKSDKQAHGKPAKRVYTSEEMDAAKAATTTEKKVSEKSDSKSESAEAPSEPTNKTLTPEEESKTKNEIKELKDRIAELESAAAKLRPRKDDVAKALENSRGSGYCAQQKNAGMRSNCEVLQEEQKELTDVERELVLDRQQLENLQEPLRKAGYGSSVYDP